MFECRKCGKRWNEKGYTKDGMFYTICKDCEPLVIAEFTAREKKKE